MVDSHRKFMHLEDIVVDSNKELMFLEEMMVLERLW